MYPTIRLADMVSKTMLASVGVPITRSWTGDDDPEPLTSIASLQDEIGRVLSREALPSERHEEIMNAIEIEEIPVSAIMVNRDEITSLSTSDDIDTNLERIQEYAYDRFPLIGDTWDDFQGIIYTPALLPWLDDISTGDVLLQDVASPPMTVFATMSVSDVIDQFQAHNQELALVMDDGGVVGLVTATDAFEVIAGEVRDPDDVSSDRPNGRSTQPS